jgi:GNAT acetyltransferase-like protein
MPPTPVPYKEWAPAAGISPLSEAEGIRLAETLPVTPNFTIVYSGLREGIDRAFVAGPLENPRAVIVQHRSVPTEPDFFGPDAEAAWSLLSRIPGWDCVVGSTEDIARLTPILERELRLPPRALGDLYYILETPPRPQAHPSVRLLGVEDVPLLERAGAEMAIGGYRTYEEVVTKGVVAAAVVDGRIVARADNSASNRRYADIGVKTLEPFRRQGLSSAATHLVALELQKRGLVPIWSTGSHNVASQGVALKVGFRPNGRGEYVIFDALRPGGGFRPGQGRKTHAAMHTP